MKQEKEYTEITLPSWQTITGMFKNNKHIKQKNPEESIKIQKYTITPEELKKDYNITGNIEKIEIIHGNITIYTKQNE